ncbi:hypothetical protein Nepgr_030879 [Nepenthes gracilis]|uniref:Uncharacterized protein n=1 Tax=Nepenthes gracilis TaxID=150966 RepID=A0AAD3TH24_NEPGR|nr:hypothetical protein Nepgr_030879 [Nepenthes gracilis]
MPGSIRWCEEDGRGRGARDSAAAPSRRDMECTHYGKAAIAGRGSSSKVGPMTTNVESDVLVESLVTPNRPSKSDCLIWLGR